MITRRMLGFGFALFLMLVIMSLIYSQYVARDQVAPMNTTGATNGAAEENVLLTDEVSPEMVEQDIIDEALIDRENLNTYAEDEVADVMEGN